MTCTRNSRQSHDSPRVGLVSDNCAPACPEVLEAVSAANGGNMPSYGEDPITSQAIAAIRSLFNADCEVFFVTSGVAANALSLAAICPPYGSIICHQHAHVYKDECGATSFFTGGAGLIPVGGHEMKLTPETIWAAVSSRSDIHYQRPTAVTITQATEGGTVYSAKELCSLAEVIKKQGLLFHVDGARLANAIAYLDVPVSAITSDIGVDVLSFGGSKNGNLVGDAIIVFNPKLRDGFRYRIKQSGHLAAKTRFLSAGWLALLNDNVWLTNARKANNAAKHLAERLSEIDGINIAFPCQANCVMIDGKPQIISEISARLQWSTYKFILEGMLRFVCSWCTPTEEVDAMADQLATIASKVSERA